MSTKPALPQKLFYRHTSVVRVCHWINVVCMTVLFMSGLQIFNATPALYWGKKSNFDHPLVAMTAVQDGGVAKGITTIDGHPFNTTGVLGLSGDGNGHMLPRAFPAGITLPGPQWLALGRRWHFFFAWLFVANGLVYLAHATWTRHLWRDLIPTWRNLKHIGHDISNHLHFRFPKERHYNVLQKLTYAAVICILLPLIILAGLAMSPAVDAGAPWLLALFGGRQSARTIHFFCAFSLLAFVIIHVVMVLLSGLFNNMRSMITGWYKAPIVEDEAPHGTA